MENIYLLRRIVARRHAEDVGVQRHVRRRLQLPPVPARHPGVGDEEERGQERRQAQAPATAQHAVSGTRTGRKAGLPCVLPCRSRLAPNNDLDSLNKEQKGEERKSLQCNGDAS